MTFGECGTGNKTIVGFEVLCKLDKMEHFFPKLDMPVNTKSDDHICLCGHQYVIDDISMHVTYLIGLCSWNILEQQII